MIRFALAAALVLAAIWIRVGLDARSQLNAAQAAQARGRMEDAIERYQYAMRAYTPGASAPAEAARALDGIAHDALARGDHSRAIAALQRVRGGALATRSLFTPFDGWLPGTNRALAQLLAHKQITQGADPSRRAELTALRLHELDHPLGAARGWSLLVVLAFASWLTGAALTLLRGFDRELTLQRAPALRWSLWTAGCFALWLLGLWQA